jgi:hypothetical protein
VGDVSFVANLESSPPGIRNPAVLNSVTFFYQRVANRSRKWDINGAVSVHVPNFRFSESEFFAPESVRVD